MLRKFTRGKNDITPGQLFGFELITRVAKTLLQNSKYNWDVIAKGLEF